MKAVLFDMDGVLTDSEPVICASAIKMFGEKGVTAAEEDFIPFIGTGENRYIGGVAEKHGLDLHIPTAKARVYEIYLEMVPGHLKAFAGAVDLVKACQDKGLKTAVASSADLIKIEANLIHIGLPIEKFDAVITAEKVTHPKPAPDIFLAAARDADVAPQDCCVIEDSVEGIRAAKAAGMHCIGVASSFGAEALGNADLVKLSIADITLDTIQSLE